MPEIGLEERLNEILTNPELRKKLGDKEVKRFLELYKRNKKSGYQLVITPTFFSNQEF